MSRKISTILALVLAIVMMCASLSFAAAAQVISPAENSICYSDSLLVSVKVSESKSVRITVFEEMDSKEVIAKDEKGKPVKTTELFSLDVEKLTEEDLVSIVEVYEGKVTDGAILSTGSKAVKYTSSEYTEPVVYKVDPKNKSGIGIYTRQLTEVKPGLYRVQVETLATVNKKEVVAETINSFVIVKEKEAEPKLFETKQNGALKAIKEVLKTIFK